MSTFSHASNKRHLLDQIAAIKDARKGCAAIAIFSLGMLIQQAGYSLLTWSHTPYAFVFGLAILSISIIFHKIATNDLRNTQKEYEDLLMTENR